MKVGHLSICLTLAYSVHVIAQVPPPLNLETKIAEATPASLPQGPMGKHFRPELSAFRLKGKVRQVTGYHSEAGKEIREIDYDDYYSATGFRTKTIRFVQGYPLEVTIYGFIDGYRVSSSKHVTYSKDENPFTGIYKNFKTVDQFTPKGPKLPRDDRYQSRIEARYDDLGRYVGGEVFHYNGEFEYKIEIRYIGDREDIKTFLPDAGFTWHWVSTIDKVGNVIETQHFNEDGTVALTELFTHTKFDAHGNWLECTVAEEKIVDGKPVRKPLKTIFRMITYYDDPLPLRRRTKNSIQLN